MMAGCSMHGVAISERVSLDAVAVRAMMQLLILEGISALTSPSCLYSGLNDSPLHI